MANPSTADSCSYSNTTLSATTGTLAMSTKFVLSFVVPLVYLQNFSGFFSVMADHAPILIEILRGLRSALKPSIAMDMFAEEHLVPFVEDIMTMEAVAMAVEGAKVSHIALGREGDQVFGREFINRAITSHLQTNCSTVVVGNNITIMNMMINTLALFLSAEDRAKSCHARKQHRYLPDLYLQGIYTPTIGKQQSHPTSTSPVTAIDAETGLPVRRSDRNCRLYHILSSPFPTTIVDTVRCKVEQTERFPKYRHLRSEYRREQTNSVIDRSISRAGTWIGSNGASSLNQGNGGNSFAYHGSNPLSSQKPSGSETHSGGFWSTGSRGSNGGSTRENNWTGLEWKGQKVIKPVTTAAPMIENLVRCAVGLPFEMREGYVRQWRRGLVKRSMALVKFVKKEGQVVHLYCNDRFSRLIGVELAEQIEQQRQQQQLQHSSQPIKSTSKGKMPTSTPPSSLLSSASGSVLDLEPVNDEDGSSTPSLGQASTLPQPLSQSSQSQPPQPPLQDATAIFQQMGFDSSDLSIVLGTAERLLPTVTEFVRVKLAVE
ncbi:hypothetical protein BGW38_006778 [Lunasporangiospora selenospora]|uniref:Uncharacterized protein n=1 Tax=Lunasporangiospora selenospora TaxID=979761 RepID=A0A9P6KAR2_9FUNG|nr:hypothetical protein BGW38_006778 [Lunasporangiospora selenospora]